MSSRTPPNAGQPPAALVRAIRKLLRPLVRLMLSHQITYPMLVNLLKSLYVEVAEQEFGVNEKRQTDSRIHLLTGVHRKDVKRLREELKESPSVPTNLSVGARLIAWWTGSDEFRDARGGPAPLPLRGAADTKTASFEDLVERVCRQDIRPRVILDDWLHQGLVHMDEHERVVLDTLAFMPRDGFEEKAFFFGKSLHDHLSASTHNLLEREPRLFDRSVYYDRLSPRSIEELTRMANSAGMEALQAINQRALVLQQRDEGEIGSHSGCNHRNAPRYRMNFGIFHYNSLHEEAGASDAGPSDDHGNDHDSAGHDGHNENTEH